MTPFEFVAVGVSIVLGLGITEILSARTKVFFRRKEIELDRLPFVWAGSIFVAVLIGAAPAAGQDGRRIIDVHRHVGTSNRSIERVIASLQDNGIERAVAILPHWGLTDSSAYRPDLFLPAAGFPCPGGFQPNGGPPCFEEGHEYPPIGNLRRAIEAGKVNVFGELYAQYFGIPPDDGSLRPYWSLAQEYGLPVGIHMSLAPPETPYKCCPGYRAAFGDPRLLEDVLVRHPDLRIYIMHAGWPFIESTISMLYVYPQLYVDVAALHYVVPRQEYYTYLKRLVAMGYEDRIMWGSDGQTEEAIRAIEEAPFLTEEQKHAIFYGNAARFFGLEN